MQHGLGVGASTLTVSEILDAYLKEHVSEKVVAKDRQTYGARHVKAYLGKMVLHAVDIPACRDYMRSRGSASPSTVRRELNILNAAANHAKKWRRITQADLPQIELPDTTEVPPVEWLTKAQVSELFAAAHLSGTAWFARFVPILYYTAARRDSVERLRKSQVDRKAGIIHLALPGEKITKKRRPSVPLYPEIVEAVDWLFEHSRNEYLFGRPRDFYKPFQALSEETGIRCHPHMLRHSRATHMLMDGESIYKVARLLGDNVSTVERVYAHSNVEFLRTGSGV